MFAWRTFSLQGYEKKCFSLNHTILQGEHSEAIIGITYNTESIYFSMWAKWTMLINFLMKYSRVWDTLLNSKARELSGLNRWRFDSKAVFELDTLNPLSVSHFCFSSSLLSWLNDFFSAVSMLAELYFGQYVYIAVGSWKCPKIILACIYLFLNICKQVVTRLLSSWYQDVFALLVPSCCVKSWTSCYQHVTRLTTVTDLLQIVPTTLIQAVRKRSLRACYHQLVNNLLRADDIRFVNWKNLLRICRVGPSTLLLDDNLFQTLKLELKFKYR